MARSKNAWDEGIEVRSPTFVQIGSVSAGNLLLVALYTRNSEKIALACRFKRLSLLSDAYSYQFTFGYMANCLHSLNLV